MGCGYCGGNSNVVRRSAPSGPRVYYKVFDGETAVTGRFRDINAANRRRANLCDGQEDCTLEVREV
jgi:hypothetical protein